MARRPAVRLAGLIGMLMIALWLSACSSGDDDGGDKGPSGRSTADGTTMKVTFSGDKVSPTAKKVELKVGQTLTLKVTADKPGEIHVHSTPEQEIAYAKGTHSYPITIKQPRVVEVESHSNLLSSEIF